PDALAEVRHRRIRVAHRPGWTHRRARAAAHAQVRLHENMVAVGADRGRRADVDAAGAAGFLRAAVGANRRLVAEIPRLVELADQGGEARHRLRLCERVGARREVALWWLMHPQ